MPFVTEMPSKSLCTGLGSNWVLGQVGSVSYWIRSQSLHGRVKPL